MADINTSIHNKAERMLKEDTRRAAKHAQDAASLVFGHELEPFLISGMSEEVYWSVHEAIESRHPELIEPYTQMVIDQILGQ